MSNATARWPCFKDSKKTVFDFKDSKRAMDGVSVTKGHTESLDEIINPVQASRIQGTRLD